VCIRSLGSTPHPFALDSTAVGGKAQLARNPTVAGGSATPPLPPSFFGSESIRHPPPDHRIPAALTLSWYLSRPAHSLSFRVQVSQVLASGGLRTYLPSSGDLRPPHVCAAGPRPPLDLLSMRYVCCTFLCDSVPMALLELPMDAERNGS
jgi:hypothetical protein